MLFGYVRTLVPDQAARAEQERSLKAFGVERIFPEEGPPRANRPGLKVCLGFLRKDDYLVVAQPDRLAGSATDLLAIIANLDARDIGLTILSLGGHTFDTRLPSGQGTRAILAGMADWERNLARERQRSGGSNYKTHARDKGRPRSINPEHVKALIGTMSVTKIARKLNISRSSAYRMLQQPP